MSSTSDLLIYTIERIKAASNLFGTNSMKRIPENLTIQSVTEDTGQA